MIRTSEQRGSTRVVRFGTVRQQRTHKSAVPNSTTGFTLVEMMVAIAIFAIVMTVGVGSLLTLVDANKKAQALKSVINNLNFALENMSRNLRTGSDYHCSTSPSPPADPSVPNDCASGGVLVAFESAEGDRSDNGDQVIYRLNGSQLERSVDGGSRFISITAAEVNITDFSFYVTGAYPKFGSGTTDSKQPRIVMTIRGTAGVSPRVQTKFNIQSTVSQRLIDL